MSQNTLGGHTIASPQVSVNNEKFKNKNKNKNEKFNEPNEKTNLINNGFNNNESDVKQISVVNLLQRAKIAYSEVTPALQKQSEVFVNPASIYYSPFPTPPSLATYSYEESLRIKKEAKNKRYQTKTDNRYKDSKKEGTPYVKSLPPHFVVQDDDCESQVSETVMSETLKSYGSMADAIQPV